MTRIDHWTFASPTIAEDTPGGKNARHFPGMAYRYQLTEVAHRLDESIEQERQVFCAYEIGEPSTGRCAGLCPLVLYMPPYVFLAEAVVQK